MARTRQLFLKGAMGASALAVGGLLAWQHSALREVGETENVSALRPFQQKIRVQNIDTRVIDAGAGPPVLMFHSIPDTSDVWESTIGALKSQFRCIAFDLPGFGQSHAASGAFDWSLENRVRFTGDLLDALGVDTPVRIIGHDAGGVWAGLFAAASGDRVERALFSISSIHPDFDWRDGAKLNRTPVLDEPAMAAFNERLFLSTVKRFSGPERSEASIRQVYQRIDGRMRRAILKFYRTTNVEEFASWHPRYLKAMAGKPVRVIWGERNPAVDHWPMLEAPQRWARDVLEFLARAN